MSRVRAVLDELGPSAPWHVTGSEHAIADRWLRVRVDRCRTEAGVAVSPYYVLEYPDWVHVVALDERERILVVRQYRHARGRAYVELPGGAVDEGETPLEAAQRELREETGYGGEDWTAAGCLAVNPATHTNDDHCFVAKGVRPVAPPEQPPSEVLSFAFVDLDTLRELIDAGEFGQALHVAGLTLALRALGWT